MDNLHQGQEERIWGVLTNVHPADGLPSLTQFAPRTTREWRTVFRQWVVEYSLHLTKGVAVIPGPSIVIHQPTRGKDCLEVVLLIVGVLRLGEPLDLDDPLTYTIWLDFLNDHRARAEHWEWWKKQRGEFHYM